MSDYLLPDLARMAILVMYGLTVGYICWIIRLYARRVGRLLPRHITLVGTAFLLAITEAAWQNATRVGGPPTWYLPYNFVVMAVSLYAMRNMHCHLYRRHPHPAEAPEHRKE